jgi:hypothetical protein
VCKRYVVNAGADNTKISVEQPQSYHLPISLQRIAPISPEMARQLPRDISNCILGVAAVHMAWQNPGNRSIERLALETKVRVFQSINGLFEHPEHQRADVLYTCITLMFAMDVSCFASQ